MDNAISTLFQKALASLTKNKSEQKKISEDLITGKKKLAEVEISARGGKGISRRTRRNARKAIKAMEDRR